MPDHSIEIAVVGASAGGVEALKALVSHLPADLPCAVVVVLHVAASGTSVLPHILERAGTLPVAAAEDDDELRSGRVYVAPPDHHVLVDGGRLVISDGPRENGHRPAIDPTMRTAAEAYGAAACGVVLSGTRDDGTAGLAAIVAAGGLALVQDPAEAQYPAMPRSAIASVDVDAVLGVRQLAERLLHAAGSSSPDAPRLLHPGPSRSSGHAFAGRGPAPAGTRFTCPDCGGVLWEGDASGVVQLRCSVGHAYSPESLVDEHARELERALWTAMRALDDRSSLMQRMADRAVAAAQPRSAEKFTLQATESRRHAEVILDSMNRFAEPPDVSTGEAGVG